MAARPTAGIQLFNMLVNSAIVVLLATSILGQEVRVPLIKSKTINLHLDSQYRADIDVGTPKQRLSCLVHTASDITAVAGKDCSKGCDHVQHRFDTALSTTFKSGRVTQAADWERRFSASGQNGVDTFTVNKTEVPEQNFIVANVLEGGYSEIGVDGILGLNKGGNTIFQNMIDRKMLEKNVMFIYHERQSEENHAGQIIFGAVDKSHIQGEPTYVPLISDKSWAIKVDEVSMDGSTVCKDCQGYVDTSIAIVKGPQAYVNRINEKIGCKLSSNDRCLIDCSAIGSLKPVVFTLGGHDFQMLPENYIQREGESCWSGFIADTQSEFWRWGDFVIDHTYFIFDHDNNQLGVAHAHEHHHHHH